MRQTYEVQSKSTTIVSTETIRIGINPVNPIRDVLHLAGQKFSLFFFIWNISRKDNSSSLVLNTLCIICPLSITPFRPWGKDDWISNAPFMRHKNRIGLNLEPWEVPIFVTCIFDFFSASWTYCVLSCKYDFIHFNELTSNPYTFSFFYRISGDTVSNAQLWPYY